MRAPPAPPLLLDRSASNLTRLMLACFILITGIAMSAASGCSTDTVATFTVTKRAYLDTESPTGSLKIDNRSDDSVSFWPTLNVFLIRDAAGNVREDRWMRAWSLLKPWVIRPGKQLTLTRPLPKCQVTSTPCSGFPT